MATAVATQTAAPAWARGFAYPDEGVDTGLVDDIVTTYASAYLGEFVDRFADTLEQSSSGLVSLLAHWPPPGASFDDVWDVSVGYARRALLDQDRVRARHQAAALGLRMATLGVAGEWQARLDQPARLRVGHWLLPRAVALGVSAADRSLTVRLRTAQGKDRRVEFSRAGRGWEAVGADRLATGRYYGCSLILLPSPALDGLHFGGKLSLSRLRPEQILAKVQKSLRLLRDHAPAYLPWTQYVLRAVIPLHAQLSEIRSGSDFDKPGVLQVSFPIRTVALAETWVHECSHQYFQILSRVGPVDDGSDRELYYSPVRRMGRPIDKILLAYHAFANVLLFYRACRASGLAGNAYLEMNELRLLPQLRELEEPLRTTSVLTDLGRALWEPLAEKIAL